MGTVTVNTAPPVGLLSAVMVPLCDRTTLYAMARPRPVPDPVGFVVKKGSKMRS
jgi:hypothetical protein